jgi:hypothetical protein
MIGDTASYTATARDSLGGVVTNIPVSAWTFIPAAWSVVNGVNPVSLTATGERSVLLTAVSQGMGNVMATIGGVTGGGGGATVFTAVDSVAFAFRSNGQLVGWTESTLSVGATTCRGLYTYGPFSLTNALRYVAQVSDPTIVRVSQDASYPRDQCFTALRSGTVTVNGTFGGRTAQKTLQVP